jgi:hypothetical protein
VDELEIVQLDLICDGVRSECALELVVRIVSRRAFVIALIRSGALTPGTSAP